jgi:hypothetical protein
LKQLKFLTVNNLKLLRKESIVTKRVALGEFSSNTEAATSTTREEHLSDRRYRGADVNSEQAVAQVISCLEELGIEYLLVGALSCNVYGVPRASADAYFVIDLGERSLHDCVSKLGPDFKLDPQLSFEILTGSNRNLLHFLPTGFDIELYRLSNDPRHRVRFGRRAKIALPDLDRVAYVQTAEDLIIQKLRWARRKDLDDIVNVLTVSAIGLDWKYINEWTELHGTTALLEELKSEAGT